MGIRLDWEIEGEKRSTHRAGEDPESRRRRRAARLRVLLFILLTLALLAAVPALIVARLRAVDEDIERGLHNTIEAEIAALRVGDLEAFLLVQRSASGEWLQAQAQNFYAYQDLKLRSRLELTGAIRDIVVDRTRARVQVEEIIDGAPYSRIWFYWRYDDGWRHVPPDYTFWGEPGAVTAPGVQVQYRDVDALVAQSVAERVSQWLTWACATLACPAGVAPPVVLEIIPDPDLTTGWLPGDAWTLRLPSPYVDRGRTDLPFDSAQRLQVGRLFASRLLAHLSANRQYAYPADAAFLAVALESWLVGRFAEQASGTPLLDTFTQAYGEAAAGRLLAVLEPAGSLSALSAAAGVPLEQLTVDWSDWAAWRLAAETEFVNRRDEATFLSFYDTRDAVARDLAYQRFNSVPPAGAPLVSAAQVVAAADGSPVLRVVVRFGETSPEQEVLFRPVDGTWRRLN